MSNYMPGVLKKWFAHVAVAARASCLKEWYSGNLHARKADHGRRFDYCEHNEHAQLNETKLSFLEEQNKKPEN
jgi:hypothetical protein